MDEQIKLIKSQTHTHLGNYVCCHPQQNLGKKKVFRVKLQP